MDTLINIIARNLTDQAFKQATDNVRKLNRETGTAYDDARRKARDYLNDGSSGANRFNRDLLNVNNSLAAQITRFVSVGAAVEVARRSFVAFADLDANMRGLAVSIGATRAETEKYIPMFREWEKQSGRTFDEIQKGFEQLRASGQLTAKQTEELFPVILRAAVANKASIEDVAKVSGAFMLSFGVQGKDLAGTWDSVTYAAQKYGLEIEGMLRWGPQLAADMALLGYRGTEGAIRWAAYLGIVNKTTGDTQKSMRALRELAQSASNYLEPVARRLGMTQQDWINSINAAIAEGKDTIGVVIGWIDEAQKRGMSLTELPVNIRAAFEALYAQRHNMAQTMDEIRNKAGEVDRQFSIMTHGQQKSIRDLVAELKRMGEELGKLLDALGATQGVEHLTGMLERINNLLDRISNSPILKWYFQQKGDFWKNMPSLPGARQQSFQGETGIPRLMPASLQGDSFREEKEQTQLLTDIKNTLDRAYGMGAAADAAIAAAGGGAGGFPVPGRGPIFRQGIGPGTRRRAGLGGPEGEGSYPPNEGTLAEQRKRYMAELDADPQLKQLAIGAMASEGGVQSNMEQLFNYANMRGMTIRQALYSGQYGPVTGSNRQSTEELLRRGARQGQKGEAALAKVGAGSNITDYATDQGMITDPSGRKYAANPQYYNRKIVEGAIFSYHGERGRQWAMRQRQIAAQQQTAGVPLAPPMGYEGMNEALRMRQELEQPIKMRFERDPGEQQFRRTSIRREVDREMREGRWASYADIGAA